MEAISGPSIGLLDTRYVNVSGDTMTGNLDLGDYGLYFTGHGGMQGADGNVYIWTDGIGDKIYLGAYGDVNITSDTNDSAELNVDSLSADRIFTFPDVAGTFALLEVANIFTENQTINGSLDVIHTATEADGHALELDVDAAGYGDVKALDIDYITGVISAGEDEGVMLLNINQISATGGDVFGLEILATDGGAGIYGMKAGALVNPILQDSGTFANPTTGTDNTASTDVPAMIDGSTGTTTAIFENDNEYIIIGAAAAFEEIEFILTTDASVNIKPTFWYSTAGTGQFTQFTPVDGTNGLRNTGVVAWDASDLTGHVADDVTGTFDIKIIRTKNNLSTSPILGYAKVAATTEYIWDKDGKITINNIESTVATGTAPLVVASTTLVSNLNVDLLDSREGSHYSLVDGSRAYTAQLEGSVNSFFNQKETVDADESITIPSGYQMVYQDLFNVDGTLEIEGTLFIN